jgi:hypothetical protein
MTETAQTSNSAAGWTVRRVGPVTFAITKPKRNPRKLRQSRLKNRRRAR